MTAEELRFTVEMVAATANEWDQKIAEMFGGKTRAAVGAEAGAEPPTAPNSKPGSGGYL